MNVTDPIADMLTRIRNASAARHKELSLPSSRVKREIARILAEEGFIDAFETQPDGVQEQLTLRLKYVEGRTPVVTGLKRISKPGLRVYARKTEIPRVLGGLGLIHPLHLPRDHDRRRRPEAESRWRGSLLRLVRSERMSRIGRMPIPLPDGVEITQDGSTPPRQGPARPARAPAPSGDARRARGRGAAGRATQRRAAPPGAARPDADAGQQHGHRRHERLHEEPGDQRRRLSRAAPGRQAGARARLLPSRSRSTRRPGSSSGSRPRPASASSAPTRSWSARSPHTSARSGSPSPTRARASATRASRSSARPARPARSGERKDRPMTNAIPRRTASQAPRPPSAPHQRQRGAAAPVGLPQREVHLCPGDRRHQRTDAGFGVKPREAISPATTPVDVARSVGRTLAERAKAAGISAVVLDRGGYQYHGRVRSLAEGAREGGLNL